MPVISCAPNKCDPFVKSFPDDAPAAWLLSRAKAAPGELDDALKLAEAALALDSGRAQPRRGPIRYRR